MLTTTGKGSLLGKPQGRGRHFQITQPDQGSSPNAGGRTRQLPKTGGFFRGTHRSSLPLPLAPGPPSGKRFHG